MEGGAGGIGRLLRLLRTNPDAVEAHLLTLPLGRDLPDDWEHRLPDPTRRVPSLRRLLVILRHLPEDSPVAAIERDGKDRWSAMHQVLDDTRRQLVHLWSAKDSPQPGPHPLSPAARLETDATKEDALERSRARDRARKARLQAQGEEVSS